MYKTLPACRALAQPQGELAAEWPPSDLAVLESEKEPLILPLLWDVFIAAAFIFMG